MTNLRPQPQFSRIADDALVGAGSVVTRDVPAFTVVAGNPARALRTLEAGEIPR